MFSLITIFLFVSSFPTRENPKADSGVQTLVKMMREDKGTRSGNRKTRKQNLWLRLGLFRTEAIRPGKDIDWTHKIIQVCNLSLLAFLLNIKLSIHFFFAVCPICYKIGDILRNLFFCVAVLILVLSALVAIVMTLHLEVILTFNRAAARREMKLAR